MLPVNTARKLSLRMSKAPHFVFLVQSWRQILSLNLDARSENQCIFVRDERSKETGGCSSRTCIDRLFRTDVSGTFDASHSLLQLELKDYVVAKGIPRGAIYASACEAALVDG